MFWRKKKKKQTEPLPWYRARNYKGNLTEEEKRELDFFRHREDNGGEKHPAADYSDLPEEVQSYLSKIRLELYDKIQETLVGRCFLASGIGALLLVNYFDWMPSLRGSTLALAYGAVLLVAPWAYYPIKWKKNANRFSHDRREGIRTEWELEYVVNKEMKNKEDGAL